MDRRTDGPLTGIQRTGDVAGIGCAPAAAAVGLEPCQDLVAEKHPSASFLDPLPPS
jgi:hypothetical protein